MREVRDGKEERTERRIRVRKDGRGALTFLNVVVLDRLDATSYVPR